MGSRWSCTFGEPTSRSRVLDRGLSPHRTPDRSDPKSIRPARLSHHLHASDAELTRRYEGRTKDIDELASYSDVKKNTTEREVSRLAEIADVVIDSERCTELDVLIRSASHLGLFGREYLRLVDVLVGGQYGSEGKGHLVSYLSREYDVLVRVGGPNAGHTVYEEPEAYSFSSPSIR